MEWGSKTGFMSNRPTLYLLDYGYFLFREKLSILTGKKVLWEGVREGLDYRLAGA